jgi:hypothetical protein
MNTLELLPYNGFTENDDGTMSQKELSGIFKFSKSKNNKPLTLSINKNSIIHGNEEKVDTVDGIITFHTHPYEAYKRNNVKTGWPSEYDFIEFLKTSMRFNTILHAVVTIEGVYIISLGDYWFVQERDNDKIQKKLVDFIIEKFYFRDGNISTKTCIKRMNNIKYDGYNLFNVELLPYGKRRNLSVDVNFRPVNNKCIV